MFFTKIQLVRAFSEPEWTVNFLKVQSGSKDERFVKSNRSTRQRGLSVLSLSLFLSFFVFLLTWSLLVSMVNRVAESTRYDRVFQAGCRLPPP